MYFCHASRESRTHFAINSSLDNRMILSVSYVSMSYIAVRRQNAISSRCGQRGLFSLDEIRRIHQPEAAVL